MKYLLTGVAAITMLTACGQKDKPDDSAAPSGIVFSESKVPSFSVHKGDAGSAAAALAAMSLETPGSGNVTWGDRTLNGDKAVFTDVTIVTSAYEGDDEDEVSGLDGADLTVAKLELDGLAMQEGAPSFSRILLSDMTFVPTDPEEAENGSGKIGSIELVNPSPETAGWVASLFSEDEVPDLPEGDALAFDQWAVKDVDFRIDDPDGEQGTFTIGTIEVTGLKDQAAALMKLDGLTFDMTDPVEDTNMKFNLASVEMRGADLGLLTDASEDASDPEEVSQMMNLAGQDPANPGYESLTLNGFDMNLAGVKVDMPKLVSAVGRDKKNSVVAVKTEPFKVSLTTDEGKYGDQLAGQLAMLGYETLELSGAGYQTYDETTDLTTYVKGQNFWELKEISREKRADNRSREELLERAQQLNIEIPEDISDEELKAKVAARETGGFRIDFGAQYAGAKAMAAAETSDDPADVLGDTLDNMIIHDMEFSLVDNGFMDRALNAYAAQSGQDPQEIRNQLTGMLAMAPMMAAGSGIDAELLTEASTALSSFVSDPKTLTIKLAPAEPLAMSTLAEMEDPSALTKESLGFSAANE
ncbi:MULTISPECIES: hypothetical protein [Hyphomonas]|uniref:DUF945 domain-containing protein n=1 Tax=Hyphomonas adhaerens TaxID=81029 RepID=A0A3B9GYG6_9PROT|nr:MULTISPECIES: hypothetical protein [Hyphomonas]MBB39725.1 hypothetical protein [Hyphomonas sp.]HAE27482.1 hypothetical protein [Hyphomonas adhaerens]|tara:strand:- start:3027 stop:4781 length:1755 start_codon:yes stop_codon:yes gene_type:complete